MCLKGVLFFIKGLRVKKIKHGSRCTGYEWEIGQKMARKSWLG